MIHPRQFPKPLTRSLPRSGPYAYRNMTPGSRTRLDTFRNNDRELAEHQRALKIKDLELQLMELKAEDPHAVIDESPSSEHTSRPPHRASDTLNSRSLLTPQATSSKTSAPQPRDPARKLLFTERSHTLRPANPTSDPRTTGTADYTQSLRSSALDIDKETEKNNLRNLEKTMDMYFNKIPQLQPTDTNATSNLDALTNQSAPPSNWQEWSETFLKWTEVFSVDLHQFLISLHSIDTEIKSDAQLELPPLPDGISHAVLLRSTAVVNTKVSQKYQYLIKNCGPTEVALAYFSLLKTLRPNIAELRTDELTSYHRSSIKDNETCSAFGARLLDAALEINSRMGYQHIRMTDVEATFRGGLDGTDRYKHALGLLKFQKHLNYSQKVDFVAQNSDESDVSPKLSASSVHAGGRGGGRNGRGRGRGGGRREPGHPDADRDTDQKSRREPKAPGSCPDQLCFKFVTTGKCPREEKCPYSHDTSKFLHIPQQHQPQPQPTAGPQPLPPQPLPHPQTNGNAQQQQQQAQSNTVSTVSPQAPHPSPPGGPTPPGFYQPPGYVARDQGYRPFAGMVCSREVNEGGAERGRERKREKERERETPPAADSEGGVSFTWSLISNILGFLLTLSLLPTFFNYLNKRCKTHLRRARKYPLSRRLYECCPVSAPPTVPAASHAASHSDLDFTCIEDSGCNIPCTPFKELFHGPTNPVKIALGLADDGTTAYATEKGTITLQGKRVEALYVPSFKRTLISRGWLLRMGYLAVNSWEGKTEYHDVEGNVWLTFKISEDNLFYLQKTQTPDYVCNAAA